MPNNTDRMVWIDLETFGLKPAMDPILEVGLKITDLELNVIDDFHALCWDSPWYDQLFRALVIQAEAGGDRLVLDMHTQSGLWDAANATGEPMAIVEANVLHWMEGHGIDRGDPLCGSSVHFDRSFLAMWMSEVNETFSYRIIDNSSTKELCIRLNPTVYARLDKEVIPRKIHRSLPDLDDTIEEYRFYKENFLVAQPYN